MRDERAISLRKLRHARQYILGNPWEPVLAGTYPNIEALVIVQDAMREVRERKEFSFGRHRMYEQLSRGLNG